jgi:cyanate permease
MENAPLALGIGLTFALIFGIFVARGSNQREPIHGGPLAQVFHYIGSSGVAGTLPVVLASLILGGGFGMAFPLALSFMATSLIALVIFAAIEQPARQNIEDRGWTEQDARTSGL